jgi:hypothetical protein
MSANLTPEQLDDIREHLNRGMTPKEIANYYGRVADLDDIEIQRIRTAANEIEQQEKP